MNFNLGKFILAVLDFSVGDYLRAIWGNAPWVEPLFDLISALIIGTIALLLVFVLGWTERKVLARMQDRIGPNRVGGRYGLLQMVADVGKMLTKEVIIPVNADKPAYLTAPALALGTSVLLFA
ncbi:MAG: NADH-quinone oxidoreductase subunit H, partial [Anaerolineales bacterium]|nr:NADH-quinone oxidoreductase subunit H [Anaerolineales bacterium]